MATLLNGIRVLATFSVFLSVSRCCASSAREEVKQFFHEIEFLSGQEQTAMINARLDDLQERIGLSKELLQESPENLQQQQEIQDSIKKDSAEWRDLVMGERLMP
jgi:hypothetical protein